MHVWALSFFLKSDFQLWNRHVSQALHHRKKHYICLKNGMNRVQPFFLMHTSVSPRLFWRANVSRIFFCCEELSQLSILFSFVVFLPKMHTCQVHSMFGLPHLSREGFLFPHVVELWIWKRFLLFIWTKEVSNGKVQETLGQRMGIKDLWFSSSHPSVQIRTLALLCFKSNPSPKGYHSGEQFYIWKYPSIWCCNESCG